MSHGVIYVATGERFAQLASISCKSLKEQEPSAKVVLFTEPSLKQSAHQVFDDVLIVESPQYNGRDKISCCLRTPFEKTVYMDCDTYIMGGFLMEMFKALDFAPLIVRPGMGLNFPWESRDYPECVNQFNTGVFAFRKAQASKFFALWQAKADEDTTHTRDQPSFRAALLESGMPYNPLASAYNFMGTNRAEIVLQKIKIVHFVGKKEIMLDGAKCAPVIGRYRGIDRYCIVLKSYIVYDRGGLKFPGLLWAGLEVFREVFRKRYRKYFQLTNYWKKARAIFATGRRPMR